MKLILIAALALLNSLAAIAADESQFTEAERLIFVKEHLKPLSVPVTLRYQYQRGGSLQEPIADVASLALTQENDKRTAVVKFLSGSEELKLPPFEGVKGNPLLLYFFEREIREMKRLTGGSMNYYRKRIRMALATEPQVRKVEVTFKGQPVQATEVRIEPYAKDPARVRYEKFADKSFVIVLSDKVPGSVLRMHSELLGPDAAAKDSPIWTETLTFDSQQ